MREVKTVYCPAEGGSKRERMCVFPLLPYFTLDLNILSLFSLAFVRSFSSSFFSSLPFPSLDVKTCLLTFVSGFSCSRDGATLAYFSRSKSSLLQSSTQPNQEEKNVLPQSKKKKRKEVQIPLSGSSLFNSAHTDLGLNLL